MADGRPTVDPNALAQRLAAGLCFALVALLAIASVVKPEFHVDGFVFGSLLLTGSALIGKIFNLWGGGK